MKKINKSRKIFYKKPNIDTKKIEFQLFTKRNPLVGIDDAILLACAPQEFCCGPSC